MHEEMNRPSLTLATPCAFRPLAHQEKMTSKLHQQFGAICGNNLILQTYVVLNHTLYLGKEMIKGATLAPQKCSRWPTPLHLPGLQRQDRGQ